MSSVTIPNDTANPLIPISNRVSDLAKSEPCTKALATPLRRTLNSLHQYLSTDDKKEKVEHEANYSAYSARLMTNLRTCLENLKENSREKFDGLMNFFKKFGENLPQFLSYIEGSSETKPKSISEDIKNTTNAHIDMLIEFSKKQTLPDSVSFNLGSNGQASRHTIDNLKSLFAYIDLNVQRNKLVGKDPSYRLMDKLMMANCVKAILEKPSDDIQTLNYDDAQRNLNNERTGLPETIAKWNTKSVSEPTKEEVLPGITKDQALELNTVIKDKFGDSSIVTNLELVPKYINLSRAMQNLFPTGHGYHSKYLETVYDLATKASGLESKKDVVGQSYSQVSRALDTWNKLFANKD